MWVGIESVPVQATWSGQDEGGAVGAKSNTPPTG